MTAPLHHPVRAAVTTAVEPLASCEPAVRARLIEDSEATVFHHPEWLTAIEGATGHRALAVVARRGERVVGVLPLTRVTSPFFGRALVGSGFAVDGGALADDDEVLAALAEVARGLATTQRVPIELRGGPALPGFAEAAGTHVTFAREIAGDRDALLQAITRRQRAEVRRSFTQGLTITHGTDERHRRAHYTVFAESVRNLGTPVFPRALFDSVLDAPGLDNDVSVAWTSDGDPISAVLTLYHRGTAMPYWGGGRYAARAARANEGLYFALMEHAVARGCTRFDFGRSKVGSGPAAYKKNWGFEAQPVIGWRWTPPGVAERDVSPVSDANRWKTRLWQRLPLPVANTLGPVIARGLA